MKTQTPKSAIARPSMSGSSLALGTAAASLAALGSANAAISYYNAGDLSISTSQTLYFDLDQSGAGPSFADMQAATVLGWDFNLSFSTSDAQKPMIEGATNRSVASNGTANQFLETNSIGGSSFFASGYSMMADTTHIPGPPMYDPLNPYGPPIGYYPGYDFPSGNWVGGATEKYLGLAIISGTDKNYGWAKVSYDPSGTLTLHDFAFETEANTPILAGAGVIPEPSTFAMLAMGAGAFAFGSRRRRVA